MATRSFAYLHAVHECEYGQVYRHITGVVAMAIRHRGYTKWTGIVLASDRDLARVYKVGKVVSSFDGTGWEGPLDDGR